MKIRYNVTLPERKSFRGGVKSDERIAVEGFLKGNMKNMCFEYETADEAKRKLAAIQAAKRKNNEDKLYDAYRNESNVYIIRLNGRKN